MTWQWVIVILGLATLAVGLVALIGWQSQKDGLWKSLGEGSDTDVEERLDGLTVLHQETEGAVTEIAAAQERTAKAVGTLAWWLVAAQSGLGQKDAEGIAQILDGTYVDKTATDTLVREPDVKVPGM